MTNPCVLSRDPNHCVEILLGKDNDTPTCWLIGGARCKQLGADYILVQPSVMENDPTRGWLPLGGRHPSDIFIGHDQTPELDLGASIEGEQLLVSCVDDTICLFRIGDRSPVTVNVRANAVINDSHS
jgi:hypothetical protein